jgi:hypothetical protein
MRPRPTRCREPLLRRPPHRGLLPRLLPSPRRASSVPLERQDVNGRRSRTEEPLTLRRFELQRRGRAQT